LFDEFEKSHLKVRNLFLQILDEGFFSDQLGKRVLLREHLLIATSNAGAEMIWDLVKENTGLGCVRTQWHRKMDCAIPTGRTFRTSTGGTTTAS
jgi:ATP-dependent Clp protease ATP-binding subunit ClpC